MTLEAQQAEYEKTYKLFIQIGADHEKADAAARSAAGMPTAQVESQLELLGEELDRPWQKDPDRSDDWNDGWEAGYNNSREELVEMRAELRRVKEELGTTQASLRNRNSLKGLMNDTNTY